MAGRESTLGARADTTTGWGFRRVLTGACVGWLAGLLAAQLQLPVLLSYWHSYAPLSLMAAAAGAVLFPTRLRGLLVGATLLLAGLWLAVCFTPLSRLALRPVLRSDPLPASADAIYVFSSSLQPDGEPTATSEARLLRGLELLGEHRAERLILSELPPPSRRYEELARQWMSRLGVAGALLAIGPVHNTHDEAVLLAQTCRRFGWHKVIAVSSPTHLRRAAATLEQQGLVVAAAPAVENRFDLEGLERQDDRFLAFGAALHDLVGYQIYRWRGWVGAPPR